MFAYDTGILKREDRLQAAFDRVTALAEEFKDIAAPHTHELVRLKETEAMLLAARFILGASLYRTESRLSHFREDHDLRDDANWLVWVDVTEGGNGPSFSKTPVPTPYCSVTLPRRKPSRLAARRSGGWCVERLARQHDEIGVLAGFVGQPVVGHDQRRAGRDQLGDPLDQLRRHDDAVERRARARHRRLDLDGLDACSCARLAAAVGALSSATRLVLLGIDTTVQRRPLPSAFTPIAV